MLDLLLLLLSISAPTKKNKISMSTSMSMPACLHVSACLSACQFNFILLIRLINSHLFNTAKTKRP